MKLEAMKKWIGFDGTPTTSIVYWAKYENFTNPMKEGYIGITRQTLEERIERHFKEVRSGNKGYFKNILGKNANLVNWTVIILNITELMSKKIEFFFRPRVNIGWNNAIGGGKPPNQKGKKQSEETKLKKSLANKGQNLGNKDSEETKLKKSTSMIGKKNALGYIKYPKNYYLEIPFIESSKEISIKYNLGIWSIYKIKKGFRSGRYNWLFEEAGLSHLINN